MRDYLSRIDAVVDLPDRAELKLGLFIGISRPWIRLSTQRHVNIENLKLSFRSTLLEGICQGYGCDRILVAANGSSTVRFHNLLWRFKAFLFGHTKLSISLLLFSYRYRTQASNLHRPSTSTSTSNSTKPRLQGRRVYFSDLLRAVIVFSISMAVEPLSRILYYIVLYWNGLNFGEISR